MRPAEILLSNCIDYAGMFPPSGLDLQTAVENFASYRAGPDSWALGRLILPAREIPAFSERWPRQAAKWPVTAVIRGGLAEIEDLTASVATVECGPIEPNQIERIANKLPSATLYIEVDLTADPAESIAIIAANSARAKIRTGGVTASAIPSAEQVVRFLSCCIQHRVPFKATAGLHHAVRGIHTLSDQPQSIHACMHGFVNVLLAAALLANGAGTLAATTLLNEQHPDSFRFTPDAITWRDFTLTPEHLIPFRRDRMVSFGSCAFTEPLEELRAAGWIA